MAFFSPLVPLIVMMVAMGLTVNLWLGDSFTRLVRGLRRLGKLLLEGRSISSMLIRSFKPCVGGVLVESVQYCYVRCILFICTSLFSIIHKLP